MNNSITLYLGDELTITGSNVEFNNATSFVKTPLLALNMANKGYVDNSKAEINNLIEMEANVRLQQDETTLTTIHTLQSEITDLTVQLNNLYQYFLNSNANGPIPVRL